MGNKKLTVEDLIDLAWITGPHAGLTPEKIHTNLAFSIRIVLDALKQGNHEGVATALARLYATLVEPPEDIAKIRDFFKESQAEGSYQSLIDAATVSPELAVRMRTMILEDAKPPDVLSALKARH